MNIKEINNLIADLGESEQKKIKAVIFKEYKADSITPADVQKVRAAVLGKIANQSEEKSAVKTSSRRAARKSEKISGAASAETMTEKSAEIITENTQQLKNDGTYTVDELIPRIESALKDFNALNDVEDWKKETITRWHGACMYIGRSLFKNTLILKDIYRRDPAGNGGTSNYNSYDYDLLSDLLDYYSILCSRLNKPVTLWGFAYFIGTDSYTINEMRDRLTPASKATFQKVWEIQERALTDRAVQGGGVTLIATLNHIHGWDGSQREQKTDNSGSLGVQSLPRLTGGE